MASEFKNLARFINAAKERVFNDALMNCVIVEIQLKSDEINEDQILPRYYNKGVWYNGEYHSQCAILKELLPGKALSEIKELLRLAKNENFEGKQQIKNWIGEVTGINDCSMAITL